MVFYRHFTFVIYDSSYLTKINRISMWDKIKNKMLVREFNVRKLQKTTASPLTRPCFNTWQGYGSAVSGGLSSARGVMTVMLRGAQHRSGGAPERCG